MTFHDARRNLNWEFGRNRRIYLRGKKAAVGIYTLSGKPRWACAMCGMYSSRKYSVKRHINNLHDGIGNIVSFIDYIAGRRNGVYFPNHIPNYLVKQTQATSPQPRSLDVMKDELFRNVCGLGWLYAFSYWINSMSVIVTIIRARPLILRMISKFWSCWHLALTTSAWLLRGMLVDRRSP